MRINDILVESKVNEAPMGALSKIGNKVAAAFGSGKSQGKVDTGSTANELKQSYMRQLGATGQEAEAKSLIAFLKAQGYPTAKAKTALGIVRAPVQAKPQTTQTTAPASVSRPQGGGKVPGQVSTTPGAVAKRNARRDATNAKATTGGAGAFNQMARQVTGESIELAEALTGQQIDAAFLAATQEKATLGAKAPAAAPADNDPADQPSSGVNALARAALGLRQRGGSSSAPAGDTDNLLAGINVQTLKAGLESIINDRPINRSARVEIQKLLKQL
jgi:hypothetical protein